MKSVFRAILTAALLAALSFTSALAIAPIIDSTAEPGSNTVTQLASSINASADTAEYTINELDMTVSVPTELRVFTRHIDPDDPNLLFYELQKEWVDQYFLENDVYLNAISDLVTYEIFISMKTDPAYEKLGNFSTSSDAVLQSFIDDSTDLYQNDSKTYDTVEIYRNEQTAYVKSQSEYPYDNVIIYSVSYFTIEDGRAIDIHLESYDNKLPAEREAILNDIVDSVSQISASEAVDASTQPSASTDTSPSTAVSPSPGTSSSAESDTTEVTNTVQPSDSPVSTEAAETTDNATDHNNFLKLLLIYLGITLVVVTLPVAVYRYIIRRRPVTKKSALLIALIYGAFVTVVAAIIVALYYTGHFYVIGGVIVWSIVNFFILSCGKDKAPPPQPKPKKTKISPEEKNENQSIKDAVMSKQCKKCLAVNLADSEECFYCGAKLDNNATSA